MEQETKNKKIEKESKMQEIKIEKVVLSIGSVGEELEKGKKLLSILCPGRKVKVTKSNKRIPSFNVRPGLEVGCLVTLRGKNAEEYLKKLLSASENTIKKKQVSENSFSFGIKEYIEIPGVEYQRDIGIIGLDVSISFCYPGKRVVRKKMKKGKLPKKQNIPKEKIIKFMEENFKTVVK
jgi:large subunit ribosomal protein L5